MRSLTLCLIAVAALGRAAAADDSGSPGVANVPHCFVALAEQADLPPQEAGVIQEIGAHEGDQVAEGQLLLQLDDRKARREQEVAEAKYEVAKDKAKDDINIRFAVASAAVAKAEFAINQKANIDVPGSVPLARLNELLLECTKTDLAIVKAKLDQSVAEDEAKVAKAEVEGAKVMVDRHKLVSPLGGVVIDVRAHKGESVQPSQAVIRIVRLDSLWVEARQVPAAKYARAEVEGQPVTVEVMITRDEKKSLPGKVIYASPLTDSGNTYMVRAKVDNVKLPNGSWLLSPGMQAEMNIQLGRVPLAEASR